MRKKKDQNAKPEKKTTERAPERPGAFALDDAFAETTRELLDAAADPFDPPTNTAHDHKPSRDVD